MIFLGIDPGLATVGVALLESDGSTHRILDCCTIETAKELSKHERIREIAEDLEALIQKYHPEVAVVETLFFQTNRKTAMDVAEARGAILLTIAKHSLPVIEPNPRVLKSAIAGDGRAEKEQVRVMLERTVDIDLQGYRDDAVDALGLAVYGGICLKNDRSAFPACDTLSSLWGCSSAG